MHEEFSELRESVDPERKKQVLYAQIRHQVLVRHRQASTVIIRVLLKQRQDEKMSKIKFLARWKFALV